MKKWTLGEVAHLADGVLVKGNKETVIDRVVIDSRVATPGCLFIPLRGERVDGHRFIADAAGRGAVATLAGCAWLESNPLPQIEVIRVGDTGIALQQWARRYLTHLPARIVGVTGSTGKTTTKEMIAAVLQASFCVLKNEGNLNTEIGLPLTVIQAEPQHELLVLEMAMRGKGEIKQLTEIAVPDIAVITNVGEAHIELLGSLEQIAETKGEILEGMADDGIAVLNGDDEQVLAQAPKAPGDIIYFGVGRKPEQTRRLSAVEFTNKGDCLEFVIEWQGERREVFFPWPGQHNVYNATAALAVGLACGMTLNQAIEGLASYRPAQNRLNIHTVRGFTVIDDTYNANPTSMRVGLRVLQEYPQASRRVAVLGDMLELGDLAEEAHFQLGELVAEQGLDELLTVGELARSIARGAIAGGLAPHKVRSFATNQEAAAYLLATQVPGQLLLIKGSRGMQMEEIVEVLLGEEGEADDSGNAPA
ncbi:MAG: UDP-N-acetylmuramoyl-tripeptide--D-alanyl-D-alanine ligase [Firmicutes bacterium]|nr:UDP-N-acetylmuramoyl-tripeptide--D-alanyl-D-alanine ligase [Bacillota bacterium]